MFGGYLANWQQPEAPQGYGSYSQSDLGMLNKALTVGNAISPPGSAVPGDGYSMRVESLDRTLKSTTYRMTDIRLWKLITKLPAFNTVEEFNQLLEYGQADMGAFMPEGALPTETDSTYERKFAIIKFMGTTRRVSHVATLIRPAHQNIISQETIAGTMYLLRQVEKALWFARSDLDSVQWDGIEKWIEDGDTSGTLTVDARGKPINEDIIVDLASTIADAPNFGTATHLFLDPKAKADVVKSFFPRSRYDMFAKPQDGLVGLDIAGMVTPAGDIRLEPDVFLNDSDKAPLFAVGDPALRPATPVISTGATSPVDAAALFRSDDAGNYAYKIVAANRFGQSAPVAVPSFAIASGDRGTWGVTPGAGGVTSYYKIYRTVGKAALAASERTILRVANLAGLGETILVDQNFRIPGTSTAFMLQMDVSNLAFKQLAPMLKVALSTVDTSVRWMQLLYGCPIVFTPRHNGIIRNIGRAPGFVGDY